MDRTFLLSIVGLLLAFLPYPLFLYAGTLSCSITTAAACNGANVTVLRMSSSTNAHSELPSQSNANYSNNVICCSGVTGLGNSCAGTFAVVAKLASTSNSHIEQNSFSNYSQNACLSISGGSVSIGYQASNCAGFDTTLASMTGTSSAHVGSSTAYTTKICGTAGATPQSLSFSISDNSVGFGTLSSTGARFATGDTLGTSTETEAHQLAASTNAASGYTVTVQGATLTASPYTITAIGSTNTASVSGVEQFGLRMTATGGSGSVTSPYAASGFAYAGTATSASLVASAAAGDSSTTTYSVRYMANISGNTEPGSYGTSLIYTATANF